MFRHLKTVNFALVLGCLLVPHLHAVPPNDNGRPDLKSRQATKLPKNPDAKVIFSPLAKMNLIKALGEYTEWIDASEISRQTFIIVLFTSLLKSQAKEEVTSFQDFSQALDDWELTPSLNEDNYTAKILLNYGRLFELFEADYSQHPFSNVTVPKWLNSTVVGLNCQPGDDGELVCPYEAVFNQFVERYVWAMKRRQVKPNAELPGNFILARTAEFLVTVWPRFKQVYEHVIKYGGGKPRQAFFYGRGSDHEEPKNEFMAGEKAEPDRDLGFGSEEDLASLSANEYIQQELGRCFRLIRTDNDRELFVILAVTSYAQSPVQVPAKHKRHRDDVIEYFKALHVAPKSIFPSVPLVLKKYSKHFNFFRRAPLFFQPRRFNIAFALIPAPLSSLFTDLLPKCTAKEGGEYRCMYGDVFRGVKQGFVDSLKDGSILKNVSFLMRRKAEMLVTVWARFERMQGNIGDDMSAAFNFGPHGNWLGR